MRFSISSSPSSIPNKQRKQRQKDAKELRLATIQHMKPWAVVSVCRYFSANQLRKCFRQFRDRHDRHMLWDVMRIRHETFVHLFEVMHVSLQENIMDIHHTSMSIPSPGNHFLMYSDEDRQRTNNELNSIYPHRIMRKMVGGSIPTSIVAQIECMYCEELIESKDPTHISNDLELHPRAYAANPSKDFFFTEDGANNDDDDFFAMDYFTTNEFHLMTQIMQNVCWIIQSPIQHHRYQHHHPSTKSLNGCSGDEDIQDSLDPSTIQHIIDDAQPPLYMAPEMSLSSTNMTNGSTGIMSTKVWETIPSLIPECLISSEPSTTTKLEKVMSSNETILPNGGPLELIMYDTMLYSSNPSNIFFDDTCNNKESSNHVEGSPQEELSSLCRDHPLVLMVTLQLRASIFRNVRVLTLCDCIIPKDVIYPMHLEVLVIDRCMVPELSVSIPNTVKSFSITNTHQIHRLIIQASSKETFIANRDLFYKVQPPQPPQPLQNSETTMNPNVFFRCFEETIIHEHVYISNCSRLKTINVLGKHGDISSVQKKEIEPNQQISDNHNPHRLHSCWTWAASSLQLKNLISLLRMPDNIVMMPTIFAIPPPPPTTTIMLAANSKKYHSSAFWDYIISPITKRVLSGHLVEHLRSEYEPSNGNNCVGGDAIRKECFWSQNSYQSSYNGYGQGHFAFLQSIANQSAMSSFEYRVDKVPSICLSFTLLPELFTLPRIKVGAHGVKIRHVGVGNPRNMNQKYDPNMINRMLWDEKPCFLKDIQESKILRMFGLKEPNYDRASNVLAATLYLTTVKDLDPHMYATFNFLDDDDDSTIVDVSSEDDNEDVLQQSPSQQPTQSVPQPTQSSMSQNALETTTYPVSQQGTNNDNNYDNDNDDHDNAMMMTMVLDENSEAVLLNNYEYDYDDSSQISIDMTTYPEEPAIADYFSCASSLVSSEHSIDTMSEGDVDDDEMDKDISATTNNVDLCGMMVPDLSMSSSIDSIHYKYVEFPMFNIWAGPCASIYISNSSFQRISVNGNLDLLCLYQVGLADKISTTLEIFNTNGSIRNVKLIDCPQIKTVLIQVCAPPPQTQQPPLPMEQNCHTCLHMKRLRQKWPLLNQHPIKHNSNNDVCPQCLHSQTNIDGDVGGERTPKTLSLEEGGWMHDYMKNANLLDGNGNNQCNNDEVDYSSSHLFSNRCTWMAWHDGDDLFDYVTNRKKIREVLEEEEEAKPQLIKKEEEENKLMYDDGGCMKERAESKIEFYGCKNLSRIYVKILHRERNAHAYVNVVLDHLPLLKKVFVHHENRDWMETMVYHKTIPNKVKVQTNYEINNCTQMQMYVLDPKRPPPYIEETMSISKYISPGITPNPSNPQCSCTDIPPFETPPINFQFFEMTKYVQMHVSPHLFLIQIIPHLATLVARTDNKKNDGDITQQKIQEDDNNNTNHHLFVEVSFDDDIQCLWADKFDLSAPNDDNFPMRSIAFEEYHLRLRLQFLIEKYVPTKPNHPVKKKRKIHNSAMVARIHDMLQRPTPHAIQTKLFSAETLEKVCMIRSMRGIHELINHVSMIESEVHDEIQEVQISGSGGGGFGHENMNLNLIPRLMIHVNETQAIFHRKKTYSSLMQHIIYSARDEIFLDLRRHNLNIPFIHDHSRSAKNEKISSPRNIGGNSLQCQRSCFSQTLKHISIHNATIYPFGSLQFEGWGHNYYREALEIFLPQSNNLSLAPWKRPGFDEYMTNTIIYMSSIFRNHPLLESIDLHAIEAPTYARTETLVVDVSSQKPLRIRLSNIAHLKLVVIVGSACPTLTRLHIDEALIKVKWCRNYEDFMSTSPIFANAIPTHIHITQSN